MYYNCELDKRKRRAIFDFFLVSFLKTLGVYPRNTFWICQCKCIYFFLKINSHCFGTDEISILCVSVCGPLFGRWQSVQIDVLIKKNLIYSSSLYFFLKQLNGTNGKNYTNDNCFLTVSLSELLLEYCNNCLIARF